MTLIEFFDKTPVDNVIAALALRPRRIVFLGADRMKISAMMPHIRKILTDRHCRTSLTMRIIDNDSLSDILKALEDVLAKEEEFVFDFTGGDDSALVALGMLFRLTDRKISVFRMECDTRQGMLYKIPLSGGEFAAIPYDGTCGENPVYLTLRENIQLHHGQVREEMVGANTAAGTPFTEQTVQELNRLWKICRSDCGFWNSQIGKMGAAVRPLPEDKSVYTLAPNFRGLEENFLAALVDSGCLHLESYGKNGAWKCTFSSTYVRDCLLKAGTLLEYKTYMTALFPPGGKDSSIYTDGGAGVVIDWQEAVQKKTADRNSAARSSGRKTGNIKKHPQPVTTRNEIDTLLMRGLTPVFISCKNGEVDTDELYKLGTVAGRFGNRYARRALVLTSFFDRDDRHYAGDGTVNYMRSRAKDMHIRLIDNVHKMSDAEFAAALRGICEKPEQE